MRKPVNPKEHAIVMAIASALDIAATLARQLPIKPYAHELSCINDAHTVWDDVRTETNARIVCSISVHPKSAPTKKK